MHFNLIHWLFDDPLTAGTNAGLSGPETFHFLYPWLIFCSLGVLIAFYYSVEGRKRFVKNKPIIKYMLDRYLGWLTVICLIGYPLIFAREYLTPYFFAWRFWRYLLLVARDDAQVANYVALAGVRTLTDKVPGYGPVMGLYSGLSAMHNSHALVVAVDMPFVQPALLSFLLNQPLTDSLLVPVVGNVP